MHKKIKKTIMLRIKFLYMVLIIQKGSVWIRKQKGTMKTRSLETVDVMVI